MALHVDHLVDAGFVTLVVDSFTSRGIGSTCTSTSKMAEATVFRQYDAVHAMRYLQDQPVVDPENIFLMGMSQGGSVAAKLAGDRWSNNIKGDVLDENPTQSWFRAFVAYYPWCPHVPKRLETPLLVLSGKEDDWAPSLGCFWHKAVVMGAPYEVEIYEGAHHSFDLPIRVQAFAGHTVGGNAAAAPDRRWSSGFSDTCNRPPHRRGQFECRTGFQLPTPRKSQNVPNFLCPFEEASLKMSALMSSKCPFLCIIPGRRTVNPRNQAPMHRTARARLLNPGSPAPVFRNFTRGTRFKNIGVKVSFRKADTTQTRSVGRCRNNRIVNDISKRDPPFLSP